MDVMVGENIDFTFMNELYLYLYSYTVTCKGLCTVHNFKQAILQETFLSFV